jgi:hypothetical protein
MRKQQIISHVPALLSFVFGMSVFAFFGYFYRYHLIYQEQYQMFLFNVDYMMETMLRPGGAAEYVARFLTQFYYHPWLGALIIACLLMLMQRQILSIARRMGAGKPVALSFIPSLFYWTLLCDEHYMLTGVVALVLVLAAFRVGLSIRSTPLRIAFRLLMLPVLYVLAGGAVVVFALLCLVAELRGKELSVKGRLLFSLACVMLAVLCVLIARSLFEQYTLAKLWTGGNYYRFPTVFPFALLLLWILTVAVVAWGGRIAVRPVGQLAAFALPALLALGGISNTADWRKEEVMRYDYCVRSRRWGEIVRLADKTPPVSPLSVAFLNLALCKQGLLPEKMFHYFQNGAEGLMPSFVRDFTAPVMAGEVYYHLGFINTAQRFAFEAMEAIPDAQKSSRAIKRLAETNLLNGNYAVAKKYIRLLQQTLYHRRWANEALACLTDEKRMEAHTEWMQLRQYRTKTDFLFSEHEKDMMLGILLQQSPSNRFAYEYLMAYCLLTKDIEHFYRYYPMGEHIGYRSLPKSYQEALMYIWGLTHNTTDNIPWPVSDQVKRRTLEYRNIYVNHPNAEPLLKKQFADTYWYYFHFRK